MPQTRTRSLPASLAMAAFGLALPLPALAQATDDNAVESAEDAFGTAVGREQIGVYSEDDVRGFSPGAAGNFRMEGLYFDIQGGLGGRIIDSEVIRVGPSAQGYAFPSPTGIVDLSLRRADARTIISPVVSGGTFGQFGLEVDALVPLVGKELGVAIGFGAERPRWADGGGADLRTTFGVVPRWRPAKGVEVLAFYNRQTFSNQNGGGLYIPNGNFLPTGIARARNLGPGFDSMDSSSQAFGLITRASLGDWTIRAGAFRSLRDSGQDYARLIFVNPDLSTERRILAFPDSDAGSWSGELRVSRRFRDGDRQHLFTAALRGRSVVARFGDADIASLGMAGLNEVIDAAEPAWTFGPDTRDATRQWSAGLSYSLAWKGLGEFTVALQRTRYHKDVTTPGQAAAKGSSAVWLPSISATATLTDTLSLYGSYTRGLEDAGTAPGFSANANAVLPAIRTRQFDGGLRWKLAKDATLILGYFNISKPYIDVDTANVYGVLGEEKHEGIEASLAANFGKNVRVVAGAVWQRPRVSASPLIAQPVGSRPVGQPELISRFNINYTLPFFPALTLDAYVNHDSQTFGTVDNLVVAPGGTRVGFGLRYKFKIAGKDATARLQVFNVFDSNFVIPVGSGVYSYNTRRNGFFYLAMDL